MPENVSTMKTAWGSELRCKAGQALEPSGCERHTEHFFCSHCQGWYGVPHDDIHVGDQKHPGPDWRTCACRPCWNKRVDVNRMRGDFGT